MKELITKRNESRFRGEEEYAFRHALLREAALAALTDDDRALGHRLAAEWLEHAGERDPVVLADHHDRAGDASRAVIFWRRAAEEALEAGDLDAAMAHARKAIERGASGQGLGELRLLMAEAHRWAGKIGDAGSSALEAMSLLPPGSAGWLVAAAEVANARGEELENRARTWWRWRAR
jgi:hypothetical protein